MSCKAQRLLSLAGRPWARRTGALRPPPPTTGMAMLSLALFGSKPRATPVYVVETSLGFMENTRLLRHLGLRFGNPDEDPDFMEAHFGPGDGGDMSDGFMKWGKGKVAESEYLNVFPAGETTMSKQEAVDWCRKWAEGTPFISVGQNCWTMVAEFLETHEGCYVTESVKFREEQVNSVTKSMIEAAEKLAEKEGRPTEDVMSDLMKQPTKLLPVLFTAENMKSFMPEVVSNAIEQTFGGEDEKEDKAKKVIAEQAPVGLDKVVQQMKEVKENVQERL